MNPALTCYPWQLPLMQAFQQAIALNRLPHAILLHGTKGLGKGHFASLMAQTILCEQAIACNLCRSCQWFQAGTHPDFQRLQPEEVGKAIKIDAVREVLVWLSLSAERAKVLILAPAQQLNKASSNALLKSLEEPNANTTLILIAEQPASVLATLRSRCQLWPMPMPSLAQSQAWLMDQGISDEGYLPHSGPLAWVEQVKTGALAGQQVFDQALRDFLSRHLPLAKFSKEIQKLPILVALNSLLSYWQSAFAQALTQRDCASAQTYSQQLTYLLDLKRLHEQGANLNWPLQWDAFLCRIRGMPTCN